MDCVFCQIRDGLEESSHVYQDDALLAFMDIRPVRTGTCLVIPKSHSDHFDDLSDAILERMIVLAKKLALSIKKVYEPERVGLVIHGYGVAHAHLIVIPQHSPDDITSGRFALIEGNKVRHRVDVIPFSSRLELDAEAKKIRSNLMIDQVTPSNWQSMF